MLLSEAAEQTFDHRSEVVQAWCNELNKQLPKGYEAVIGINESTCGAQAPIPCIDVFNRDYKPTGQFVLEVARHPLYIGFEDKNTGDWTKEPLVICSNTDFDENGVPHFKGYGLIRTRVMTAQEYNEWKKKRGN